MFLADFAAGSFLPMSWKRLLKAEAGGAGADQFLEAVPGGAGDETGIDRGEPLWQNC